MLKIIIADDHTVVRHGLKEILTRELGRVKIAEARDAREATDLLGQDKWDLVLLDINMPGRSGLEVLGDFNKPGYELVPVVLKPSFSVG